MTLSQIHVKSRGWIFNSRTEGREAMGLSTRASALFWHRMMLPDHFKTGAGRKYNYEKRTAKYMKAKASMKRHQRPLSWTGAMEDQATTSAQVTTSGTTSRLAFRTPRAVNFSSRDNYPDLGKELTTVTAQEEIKIGRIGEKAIQHQLNAR